MNREYSLLETTADVYRAIYNQHRENMSVFESFTDVEGVLGFTSHPTMETFWGIKGSYFPLIASIAKKVDRHQRDWDYTYFIVLPKNTSELQNQQQ